MRYLWTGLESTRPMALAAVMLLGLALVLCLVHIDHDEAGMDMVHGGCGVALVASFFTMGRVLGSLSRPGRCPASPVLHTWYPCTFRTHLRSLSPSCSSSRVTTRVRPVPLAVVDRWGGGCGHCRYRFELTGWSFSTRRKGGYAGVPSKHVDIDARDVEHREARPGHADRLWARGPAVEAVSVTPSRLRQRSPDGAGCARDPRGPGWAGRRGGASPGDVITAVEGRAVRDLHHFHDSLARHRAGETVSVTLAGGPWRCVSCWRKTDESEG